MYTIYLDMDGVLADFEKEFRKLRNTKPEEFDREDFRKAVFDHKIFEKLDPMPDAKYLLDYVSKLQNVKVEILTSMGTFRTEQGRLAREQKLNWLTKMRIPYKPNFVRAKPEKAFFATPKSILIDDSIGCIEPFIAKGGIGILHKNARDTIAQLEKVLKNA